jgi:hypothetical protein
MEGALFYSARQCYACRKAAEWRARAAKVRKYIDSLTARELADLRGTVKQALALHDKRSFDYFRV